MNMLFITCKVNNFRSKLLLKTVENPFHNPSISTVCHVCILSGTIYNSCFFHIPNLALTIFNTVPNIVFNSFIHTFKHRFLDE